MSKHFNFSGSMTCEIKGSGAGYTHNETQTWDITGPLVSGQEWVFPALWSTVGSGSASKKSPGVKWNATWNLAAVKRVELVIQPVGQNEDTWRFAQWSAQAKQDGGVTGVQTTQTEGQKAKTSPISGTAWEAILGKAQYQHRDASDVVTGSLTSDQAGPNTGLMPGAATWTVKWTWKFTPARDPVLTDQAFAPGDSADFDVPAREALALRRPDGVTKPTTNVLSTSGTLENFMRELVVSPVRVPRPVPCVILLSHAGESGWLEMQLTDKPGPPGQDKFPEAQYEELTKAGTKLNIPEEVLTDAAGTVHPAIVRIRGCRIGLAGKFLRELKKELKNVSTIVAPKHYQGAATWTDATKKLVGRMEFLSYCFESYPGTPVDISGKAPPAITKQQIVNVLNKDRHVRVDGSPVPSGQWVKWLTAAGVPASVQIARKYYGAMAVRLPSDWQVDPSAGDLKKVLVFEHVITTNNGPWDIGGANMAKGTAAARRDFVKAQLRDPASKKQFPMCFEDHPWPIWERYLKVRYETFSSFDDFMAGFDWVYEADGWHGMRHVYRLLVPITLPADQNILLANYYPVGAQGAHIGLDETDGVYFAVL